MITFRTAMTSGRRTLSGFSDSPALDSMVLLAFAADTSKEKVVASYPDPVPQPVHEAYLHLLDRRVKGVPVAYLTGVKEFYGERYYVDPNVLIPRPDTEIIVEAVLAARAFKRILDLGTGSGCIAISLATQLPDSDITASDTSRPALEVCRRNSLSILGRPLRTIESDLFSAIGGGFDCIVSNPPYLTDDEWQERSDLGWIEPESALRAGADGLDLIRKIVKESVEALAPNGYLFIEAAPAQFAVIRELFARTGYSDIRLYQDLAGDERVISGVYRQER